MKIPTNHRQAEEKLIIEVNNGFLEIDVKGQIWRLAQRQGCRWVKGNTIIRKVKRRRAEKQLPNGYMEIIIYQKPKIVCGLAHRLVWRYFNGKIPLGLTINHKNGIKNDNRPENLEVATYSQNRKHAFKLGLINQNGERNPAAKLTEQIVLDIRKLRAGGKSLLEIAKIHNTSFQQVSAIANRTRWAYLK